MKHHKIPPCPGAVGLGHKHQIAQLTLIRSYDTFGSQRTPGPGFVALLACFIKTRQIAQLSYTRHPQQPLGAQAQYLELAQQRKAVSLAYVADRRTSVAMYIASVGCFPEHLQVPYVAERSWRMQVCSVACVAQRSVYRFKSCSHGTCTWRTQQEQYTQVCRLPWQPYVLMQHAQHAYVRPLGCIAAHVACVACVRRKKYLNLTIGIEVGFAKNFNFTKEEL